MYLRSAPLFCFGHGLIYTPFEYASPQGFYVGKACTGVLQIITLGGLGIWVLIDFSMIIVGKFTDKQGKVIETW